MNAILVGEETIPVRPNAEHVYLLETALVAKGYGVDARVIRDHKRLNAAELVEGKHWISVEFTGVTNSQSGRRHGSETRIMWTKRGVVRLGFFIKSERAKLFRDAAEDLVIEATGQPARGVPVNYSEAMRRLAGLADFAAKCAEAANLISPQAPFGTMSKATGMPRTKLVPAYYRTGAVDGVTTAFLAAEQQLQFAFWVVEEAS